MDRIREKRCPLCRHVIRADAAFCRHCNADLEDEDLLVARRGTRRIAIGLAGLFGLIILILVASLFNR